MPNLMLLWMRPARNPDPQNWKTKRKLPPGTQKALSGLEVYNN